MSDFDPPVIVESPRADALASVGQRALAQVLDGLIIGFPLFILSLSFGGDLTDAQDDNLLWLTLLWLGVGLLQHGVRGHFGGHTGQAHHEVARGESH